MQPVSGSPLTGADEVGSVGRPSSAFGTASDGPFLPLSPLLGCYKLPAEIALVGSSEPELAWALTSSLLAEAEASTLSRCAGASGSPVLLVIQSSIEV